MRKMRLLLAILFVALIGAAGCGVISHGSTQDIRVNAPSDLLVKAGDVSALSKGSTVLKLSRKKEHTITAEKDGTSVVCGQVKKTMSVGYLLADIFWMPIGLIIDGAKGGWYNLEPAIVTCQVNDSPKTVIENKPEPQIIEKKIESQKIVKKPEQQTDSASKLSKLKELYDGGLISKSEYDSKRAKILESL